MSYEDFSLFYDRLTENIDYEELASCYVNILKRYGLSGKQGELLDLACGSGNVSLLLKKEGYKVTGCDLSPEMLTAAAKKDSDIRWICADMARLPFNGDFDCVVCALDGLNHLESRERISETFKGVYNALKPGGVFAADMNTVYKHINVLGNNAFTFDYDGLYCGWQNELDENDPLYRVDMFLDFFCENEDGTYERFSDSLSEIAVSAEETVKMLEECGFEVCEVSEYPKVLHPSDALTAEKFMFAARKNKKMGKPQNT